MLQLKIELGHWFFKLRPQEAGGPHTIKVQLYPVTVCFLFALIQHKIKLK